ncbi:MAG: hypothetical protein IH577_03520 [Deltaproteobacteria bacterium]|nr:hypothetical protein [Deltaproteobacteria bacterium]
MGADNRDAIVDAVVARMQTITVANGYVTNAGARVYRWKASVVAPSECPAIDVRDPDRRPLGVYAGGAVVRDYELTVEITGLAASGADTDGGLNLIVADIMKAVLEGDQTWGGKAIQTKYDSDRKGIDQRDVKVGIGVVRFLIHYRKT